MNIGSLSNIEFVHRIAARVGNMANNRNAAEEALEEFKSDIRQSEESVSEQTSSTYSSYRWTSEPFFIDDFDSLKGYTVDMSALNKVREKLREEGINADKRTPTHEITDEQMEWLNERHDLGSFTKLHPDRDPEYGNFILDLVYLNVLSPDEAENLFGILPINANNKGILYQYGDPDTREEAGYVNADGSISETLDEYIAWMNNEYLKTQVPDKTDSGLDKIAEELIIQRSERFSLLEAVFSRFSKNITNGFDITKPFIENASEKLKEDFGSIL